MNSNLHATIGSKVAGLIRAYSLRVEVLSLILSGLDLSKPLNLSAKPCFVRKLLYWTVEFKVPCRPSQSGPTKKKKLSQSRNVSWASVT